MAAEPKQDLPDENPGELVRQASQGDSCAVEALLHRHLPFLHAYLRLRMGPLVRVKESESDLAQSICREVLESIEDFEYQGEAAFKGWLCTMALRKLAQRQRYFNAEKRCAAREVEASLSAVEEAQLLKHYRNVCTPSRNAVAREELERVELAFAALPEHYREIITLARMIGLPHNEIAKQIGRSEVASQRLLARALVRLSDLLQVG